MNTHATVVHSPPVDPGEFTPEPATSRTTLAAALSDGQLAHRATIGVLLTAAGMVDVGDISNALVEQKKRPDARIGDLLIASGKITEESVYRALAGQLAVPYVRLGEFDVDPAALALLPPDIARAHRVLPLMLREKSLVIATDDPADTDKMSALRFRAQRPIEAVLASPSDLDAAIAAKYAPFNDATLLAEADRIQMRDAYEGGLTSPERMAEQKPIVRLVSNLLLNAIQRHASDVHLRPREHHAEARYRIDGSLVLVGNFNSALVPAIAARIKVLANLDVTERRLAQDGAIHMDTSTGTVDMRVSIMPAIYGENVVIRILDRNIGLRRLRDIGFNEADGKRMRSLIDRNQGLILVTGPPGSGKTTTLYAALQELNTGEYQIITVEDPVEYRIDGLVQIQTQPGIDWGFPQVLRHILRHDPDIVLIGEIRDAETAKIAIESALTGHLVFSTVHTNSAAQTVTRLLEIGIPPYLVTSTLAGVLAQRLARRNCNRCKAQENVPQDIRDILKVGKTEVFWRGAGCDECFGTGYRGRIAAYELLQMSPSIRALVRSQASYEQMEEQAVKEGMTRLTDQALNLARTGVISMDEVMRVRLD